MLNKKGLKPNKAKSPLKNLDVDMQYRSSADWTTNSRLRENNLQMNAMIKLRKSTHQYHIKERILRISFHNMERVNCLGTNQSFNHLKGKSLEPHV